MRTDIDPKWKRDFTWILELEDCQGMVCFLYVAKMSLV